MNKTNSKKLLFVVSVDWFFLSHRLPIAIAAMNAGYEVHLVTKITNKLEQLKNHGFTVHPINIQRGAKDGFSDVLATYHIYKVLKKVCPDIVHLVTLKVILLGGIASRIAKIPSIVYSVAGLGHIFVSRNYKVKILKIFIGLAFRFILSVKNKKVIFQNNDDADIFKKITNLKSSESILLPGSGVDLLTYKPSLMPKNEVVIAMISRMLGDKGVYEFIEAVKILKSMKYINPKYRFVLVGDVDYDNPTSLSTNQLKSWEKDGLIEYMGHQNNIPEVLEAVSVVVLPSYREGFPKILIESFTTVPLPIKTLSPTLILPLSVTEVEI